MHVIGTAGHVDHGKTTLIEAMTGINPDRLPEEKERGMTIDLGFAWFPGKDGEPVGVIDVPGHERFIRNMVAGAWSLDCALLLVAADDGWMQQTQDHAVVLSALAVPSVILVITKTDIAPAERVQEVRRDASARCASIFGSEPPTVEVSALAGRNVDALKALIVQTLAGIPEPAIPEPAIPERAREFPFLYVDRVFSIKGSGLVVTGSLKGAPLAKEDPLELLPAREVLRVRAMQTYNAAVDRALPTSRVALNLQKPKNEIARGACITAPGAPFHCEREIFARVRPIEMGQQAGETPVIKNHSEVEVALGTGHEIAQIHYLGDPRFARIQLRNPLPALWNQPFLVIRHGGSAILGSGRVLWFGEVSKDERRRFTALLAAMPEPAREEDQLALQLGFRGLARRGNSGPHNPADTVVLGDWIFHAPWLAKLSADIVAIAGQPAGISALELESKLRLDGEALRAVLSSLLAKGALVARRSLYFTGEGGESELPPAAKKLLAEILGCGRAGYQAGHAELKTLVRRGLVVPLEGGIFYARETYDSLASQILVDKKPGDRFSIPAAKERTGLSRKYMLPLLNRMEKDGRLKRDGDARVVL